MKDLNQSLDLIHSSELTDLVTTARAVRADRASGTQEAILKAAERLYAEHGVFAVSNRQVSEAAGQGNNAAVGYHFGTKTDLVRAIEQKHRASIERLLERMVADIGDSTELRDWITCMVCSLTEHLAQLGNPTTYARFAAQALAVNKDMGWDSDIVNVNGGAIAIGHPIGASGGRVLVTLLHEMQKRDAKKGLATLCIGGGMGVAMCVER